jgi:hypothetical protein
MSSEITVNGCVESLQTFKSPMEDKKKSERERERIAK